MINRARSLLNGKREIEEGVSLLPYQNKHVLITGACGTIGSALFDRLLLLGAIVTGVDQDENQVVLARLSGKNICLSKAANVGLLANVAPVDICFHAAAYKHVCLGELFPASYMENNTQQTRHLLNYLHGHFTDLQDGLFRKVIMVSTDKVSGDSVMGQSKHKAEQLIKEQGQGSLRLVNLIRSRGSVIDRWENGCYVYCSDNPSRYWMTLADAVYALLVVGLMPPAIYSVWDMPKFDLDTLRNAWKERFHEHHGGIDLTECAWKKVPLGKGESREENLTRYGEKVEITEFPWLRRIT